MTYSNTLPRNNQPPFPEKIDFDTLAPAIIDDVAHELIDRPYHESDREIRFGNRGSFSVNKRLGTFYDHEQQIGGGLLEMICHLCGFEKHGEAFNWLREKGYLDGTFTSSERSSIPHSRRQRNRRSNTGNWDGFEAGLKLWQEAETIPYYQHHPVRRWCLHRKLFPVYKELPSSIRWHAEKHFIIIALAPIFDFVHAYPADPEPKQFHLIAIDKKGRKRRPFPGDQDKRTWGRPGATCIAMFGDPNADEIYVAEGVADALAIFSRHRDTPVIATIGGLPKLANCSKSLDWLSDGDKRAITIFPDNDEPGRKGRDALMEAIGRRRGDVCYVENWRDADPADAAAGGVQ